MNGIEVANELRNIGYENIIVFITSFADYSLDGYKVSAFRYIIKDNLESELKDCIYDIIKKQGIKQIIFDKVMFDIRDFVYAESDDHHIDVHLINGEVHTFYNNLNNFEKLCNSELLLRVHKSYLVNTEYVKEIRCYELTLKNDIIIPIPKAKYGKVLNKISIRKAIWG